MAKMIELTTTREAEVALAEPRPVRRVRITPTSKYGRRRYHLDNWLPVPPVLRHLDGRTWRGVLVLAGLALAAMGAVGWWIIRLLGRAR